jgi:hypothetical protein
MKWRAGFGQRPTGHVRSVEKAIDLIEALADESRGLSLAELAKRTGFNPSTAHHLVATLRVVASSTRS